MSYECMKTPTSVHRAAAYESYFADFRPVLLTMEAPARIFWAKYGVIDEPTAMLLHRSLKNSELVFFEHSGHLLPWTEKEKFNSEMLSFAPVGPLVAGGLWEIRLDLVRSVPEGPED